MATWAEQETALSMLQHLLLGTELHLYQPSEYCMIYWWAACLPACLLLLAGPAAAAGLQRAGWGPCCAAPLLHQARAAPAQAAPRHSPWADGF